MKEKIEALEKLKNELRTELAEFVKDKTVPLNERWDLFFKSKLGTHSGFITEFKNMSCDDMVCLQDRNKHEIINLKSFCASDFKSEDEYNEFREDVLTKFISTFEWDW